VSEIIAMQVGTGRSQQQQPEKAMLIRITAIDETDCEYPWRVALYAELQIPLTGTVTEESSPALVYDVTQEWCLDNCTGPWFNMIDFIFFERHCDAIKFQLKF
jgi:hypothetical protein